MVRQILKCNSERVKLVLNELKFEPWFSYVFMNLADKKKWELIINGTFMTSQFGIS